MKKSKFATLMVVMIVAGGMSGGSVAAKEGAETIAYETMVDRAGDSESTIVAQGSCGEGVTYSLCSDGVLTIYGSGRMADYEWAESPFYEYQDQIKELVIEAGVTYIGKNTFCDNNMLQVVNLATTITEIGESAFGDCYKLSQVILNEGVVRIGTAAFSGCGSLTSIQFPNSLESIGDSAFSDSGLTSITLPAGLTRLEEHMFAGCSDLTKIEFPENLEVIGTRAFYFCTGIEKLENFTVPNGITCLEYQTFGGCYQLQTVVLPGTLKSIGMEAFTQCNGLVELTIPQSVTSVGNGAFAYCKSLKEIVIPQGVTSLGETVFRQCDALEFVTIPKSVTSIDKTLFYLVEHDITIVGELGSYAQTFAQEIKMPFRSLDGTVIQPTCTITYDPTGGVLQGEGSKTVVKNTSIGKHPTATKEGHVLKGWYLYRTGGTQMPEHVPIRSDLTVYAVWEMVASDSENNNQGTTTDDSNQSSDKENTTGQNKNEPSNNNANNANKEGNGESVAEEKVKRNEVYTVGAYKYKVLNQSEVSFIGIKSSKTKKVEIPKSVKIQGQNFKVTSISTKALRGKNITSLVIGANIKKIESKAFEKCKKLKKAGLNKKIKVTG